MVGQDGRRAGAGRSAAAEYRRRSAGLWWRRPVSRVLGVAALAGGLWLVGELWRGLVDGAAALVTVLVAGLVAVLVAVAAVMAIRVRPEPDAARWQRGAEGERATAEVLGRLPRRFVVSHDLAVPRWGGGPSRASSRLSSRASSGANIDHLVIGPTGVFVIDSKAYRSRLRVRRGSVWAGDWRVDTGPAMWEGGRISDVLGVPVVAIVAVHGYGLRRRGVLDGGVRVVPAARLARTIKRRRGRRELGRRELGRRGLGRRDVAALVARAAERLSSAG